MKQKFLQTHRPINDSTALYIVRCAESHPHYTQILAHTIWEYTSTVQEITDSHVQAALEKILARV